VMVLRQAGVPSGGTVLLPSRHGPLHAGRTPCVGHT
jgi:hypothetical protein